MSHYFNVIIRVFIHVNYYKLYNFIKSETKKLKVVEVLQYNGVNMKMTSTKRTTVKMGLLHHNMPVV